MRGTSHGNYWRGQVWPRRRRLFPPLRLAVVGAAAVATSAVTLAAPLREVRVSELATAGLAFAALAFGAAISGAVLVLTAPAPEIRAWARTSSAEATHSDYSDLIFAFTWSAMSQIAVVVVCVLAMIFGGDREVAPTGAWRMNYVSLGAAAAVFYYALGQLVVVVRTISQVAFVLIEWWKRT